MDDDRLCKTDRNDSSEYFLLKEAGALGELLEWRKHIQVDNIQYRQCKLREIRSCSQTAQDGRAQDDSGGEEDDKDKSRAEDGVVETKRVLCGLQVHSVSR